MSNLPFAHVLALIARCEHCGRDHKFGPEQISSEGKIKGVGYCEGRPVQLQFPRPNVDRLRDANGLNVIVNANLSHDLSASYACPVCRAEHAIDLRDLFETIDDIGGVEQFCRGQYFHVFLEHKEYRRALNACSSVPYSVRNDEDYARLAPGSRFVAPDGTTRTKPMLASNQIH